MQQPIQLNKEADLKLLLLYALVGGLSLIALTSLGVYFYLEKVSPTYSNATTQNLAQQVESAPKQTTDTKETKAETDTPNPQESPDTSLPQEPQPTQEAYAVEEGPYQPSTQETSQIREFIQQQRETYVVSTTEFTTLDGVYTISEDKRSILKDGKHLITVEEGTIQVFGKPAWESKIYVITHVPPNNSYLLEYTLTTEPIKKVLYRYEGAYRMYGFLIPSDQIVFERAPEVFYVVYAYPYRGGFKLMAQRLEKFKVSRFEIKQGNADFSGINSIKLDKNTGVLTVLVDTPGGIKEFRYFGNE